MFRPISLFIGTRYTRAKRRNYYISFISLTSMVGLGLGVLALIVVLSVLNGFQQEMRTRILGMVPHVTLAVPGGVADWPQLAEHIEQNPEVVGVAPFAELDGMFSYKGSMQPVQIYGVEPEHEAKVSMIGQRMTQGQLNALQPGEFGVVIGDTTARRFRLGVGDKLTLIVPEVSNAAGGITPRMLRLTVSGVFKVGAELDGSLALIHVADAATLQRLPDGSVAGVRLALDDLHQAQQVSADLAQQLGGQYQFSDWTRTQGSLFSAMQMEKTMVGLLLLLIVAVAAFNIIATLIMVVADKRTDIAILRTLGATPSQIMAAFMVQGTVIGLIGTLIGTLLGVTVALNITEWAAWLEQVSGLQVFSADMYFVSSLPSQLQAGDVLLVCSAALIMSFLATIYPSWRASRTQPAEALRYE